MPAGFSFAGKAITALAVTAIAAMLALAQKQSDRAAPQRLALAESLRSQQVGSSASSQTACLDLAIPVAGVTANQLIDTFSDSRSEGRRHDAIDIMAPLGTMVVAAASGRVEKLFASQAGGNTIYVRSPDGGLIYYYAHLDSYAPGLHQGQAIVRGAPLGRVGYSGNADPAAPHLHFAMLATAPGLRWWESAQALNPYSHLAGIASQAGCR